MFWSNRKKKTLESTVEISYPIRAVVGIGDGVCGIGLLFKKSDGSAGFIHVWSTNVLFERIHFIDEGESRIMMTRSFWSDGTQNEGISQIYLR